ncbi:MAG: hypothetical protein RLZZ416_717 [Candidatus Parcubacteria bacterium]|jgi:hypothetical protein
MAEQKPGMLASVLAIIGFIIVIVIVVWGFIHLASISSPWFSSLFSKSSAPASLQVSAPSSANSGEPFTVSWKSAGQSGFYTFMYQCKEGLKIEAIGDNGIVNTVPCGAAYTVSSASNSLRVVPLLAGTAATPVTVSMTFIPSATNAKRMQGSAVVTIQPGAKATSQPLAKPAASKPVAKPVSSGPADLSVRVVSLASDGYGNATFVFDISNEGRSSTGSYVFEAHLPTSGEQYRYVSPVQTPLAPGAHVTNTLTFSDAISGAASVTVDPSNAIREENETNNYASRSLFVSYLNYDVAPNYAVPPVQYYPSGYQYPTYTYPNVNYNYSGYPYYAY